MKNTATLSQRFATYSAAAQAGYAPTFSYVVPKGKRGKYVVRRYFTGKGALNAVDKYGKPAFSALNKGVISLCWYK